MKFFVLFLYVNVLCKEPSFMGSMQLLNISLWNSSSAFYLFGVSILYLCGNSTNYAELAVIFNFHKNLLFLLFQVYFLLCLVFLLNSVYRLFTNGFHTLIHIAKLLSHICFFSYQKPLFFIFCIRYVHSQIYHNLYT